MAGLVSVEIEQGDRRYLQNIIAQAQCGGEIENGQGKQLAESILALEKD